MSVTFTAYIQTEIARSNSPTKKYDVISICSDRRSEGQSAKVRFDTYIYRAYGARVRAYEWLTCPSREVSISQTAGSSPASSAAVGSKGSMIAGTICALYKKGGEQRARISGEGEW